jgi:hypothetical protein
MRRKFQVDMSPTELAELQRVASHLGIARTSVIRFLVHQAHQAVVRGETAGNVPTTERGE